MHAWRSTLLTTMAGVSLALALAPDAAEAASETRQTGDFQAIAASGNFDIHVRQGDSTSVQIEGDEQAIAEIETEVAQGDKGPTLKIRQRSSSGSRVQKAPVVWVTTARLSSVALSGSGDLTLDPFNTPELTISLAGSGDAKLAKLDTKHLKVRIAGSGEIRGDGRAAQLALSIAGSGDAKLRELKSEDVEVAIAGSGDAEVHAERTLNVRIAGSGDVRYAGTAAVRSRVVGSGSARPLH